MVNNTGVGTSPIRCAIRMLFHSVQTTHIYTTNPFSHFVGEEEAPKHVCYVDGRLHLVQVGWSKAEAENILKVEIGEVVMAPQEVFTPAFSPREVAEINRAFAYVERNDLDLVDALSHMAPSLAREIRRVAGNRVWSYWAHDTVQTDLRLALEASVAAVELGTPLDGNHDAFLAEVARYIRLTD